MNIHKATPHQLGEVTFSEREVRMICETLKLATSELEQSHKLVDALADFIGTIGGLTGLDIKYFQDLIAIWQERRATTHQTIHEAHALLHSIYEAME